MSATNGVWVEITKGLALRFWGDPNSRLSNIREWRWGNRGSRRLDLKRGTWHDFEAGKYGGAIDLVMRETGSDRSGAVAWLRRHHYLTRRDSLTPPHANLSELRGSVRHRDDAPDRLSRARARWSDSEPIPSDPHHPARMWLAARNLWRPEVPVPEALRWLPRHENIPAAGLVIVPLAHIAEWALSWPTTPVPQAVHTVAVSEDGTASVDRSDDLGLGKRTVGVARNHVVVFGSPIVEQHAVWRVAEGVADALAIASRCIGPVVATIGTAGWRSPVLARWLSGLPTQSVLHADNDVDKLGNAGLQAANSLATMTVMRGGDVVAVIPHAGKDPADIALNRPFPNLAADWLVDATQTINVGIYPPAEAMRRASIASVLEVDDHER